MTTCNTIHTVSGLRRHRPMLLALLTAVTAVGLCALLVLGLSGDVLGPF